MATETTDYAAVLHFLEEAKIRECYVPTPEAPDELREPSRLLDVIPYLGLGLTADYRQEAGEDPRFRAFATGWTELEGVMLLTPETDFDADVRVALAAKNERALRDLLLSFPTGKLGFCYLGGEWMIPALDEILDGRVLPSREGYFASARTLTPRHDYPARRLQPDDYPLVQAQWSETVWQEMLAEGYAVHACLSGAEPDALCFHWPVAPWRREVHGLQAVRDFTRSYAESVISSATEEVIAQGKVATCTANLANEEDYLNAFRQVGYRLFYRVPSYLGVKRGTGRYVETPLNVFFGTARKKVPRTPPPTPGAGGQIQKSNDPILTQFADLSHAAGRRERSQLVAEGILLVQRAWNDGLPVEHLLYTSGLLRSPEGAQLLSMARQAGVPHSLVTEGLMGKVTTTRPVPPVLAAIFAAWREAELFEIGGGTTLLVAENISNPDNLGMILRTADAAGVEGVVVAGAQSDPFHKNCVRAARGAVGRIPILACRALEAYLRSLRETGLAVVGAALGAESALYRCALETPIAVVVGNEQAGISRPVLEACSLRVQIPMAPGQDSLNVGVAAGLMLYEIFRQKISGIPLPDRL